MNISGVGSQQDLFGANLTGADKGFEKSEILDIKGETHRAEDSHRGKSSGNK
jgi:hypothetical protein